MGRASSAALAALLAVLVFGCMNRAQTTRPRNLVLIVVDTLRQDHLECYGHYRATAPTICRLAAEGMRLDGLSPSSWTKPATASILTGLHPLRHQAINRNDRLPSQAVTLAERLAGRGFQTLGVSANGWVSEQFGFDQGFAEFHFLPHEENGPAIADRVNAAVVPLLRTLGEPFFLYLHYIDPHTPYAPPPGWDGSLSGDAPLRGGSLSDADLESHQFRNRDPELLRDARKLYDGEIRFVDSQIASLLEHLDGLGLLARTLTVVTSDHGEEFEEHGRGGHGLTLYGEVTRVPLILHAPATLPRGAPTGFVGLADLVPTITGLLEGGSGVGETLDGVDLSPALLAGDREIDPSRQHLLHLDLDGRAALALVGGGHKLNLAQAPYRKELFDLSSDPREQDNLFDRPGVHPPPDLAGATAAEYNRLGAMALPRETIGFDAELASRIRALGYLAPGHGGVERRLVPSRIRTPDALRGGLQGWEPLRSLLSCVHLGDPSHIGQLLEGWRFIEADGRWALPHASLYFPALPTDLPGVLELRGASLRPGPFELSVTVDGIAAGRTTVHPGEVKVDFPLPSTELGHRAVVVALTCEPPFDPPEKGKRAWRLGVFLRTACLRADPGRPSADDVAKGP